MYKQFNKEWRDWINLNIARGCDKNGIYKILIDEGFDPTEIEKQMKYSPDININAIVKPLKSRYCQTNSCPFSICFTTTAPKLQIIPADKTNTNPVR